MSPTRKIVPILFFVAIFLTYFLPVNDADFGWHYRCGKLFLTSGDLCSINTFSYVLPNHFWAFPQLIYNATLALIFDHFGFLGLSFLGALVISLAFGLMLLSGKGQSLIKVIGLLFVSFLSFDVLALGYRSQVISLLFFVLEVYLLKKSDENKKILYILPPLFLLWANTHSGFFLGPLIFFLFLIEKFTRNKLQILSFETLVFSLGIIGTLLNPFGPQIYLEVLNHFLAPLNTMIAEWTSPPWEQQLFILLTALITLFISKRRHSLTKFTFTTLIIFAYLAATARRNIPLYYFSLFLWTTSEFNLTVPQKHQGKLTILTLVLLTMVTFTAIRLLPYTQSFDTNFSFYCQSSASPLPCQALEKLKGKSGNLFASYQWGGYLIWQLPEMKVFVDGRMSAWKLPNGSHPYQVYLSIIQTQNGWNEILTQTHTDYLLINTGTFLDVLLQNDKDHKFGWKEIYRDDLATAYEKI